MEKKNVIGAFYQTVGVQKEWAQVVKSIGHEFLITQYKNHSRYTIYLGLNCNYQIDQHDYQWNQRKANN